MGAVDLSSYLWPDAGQGRQPQTPLPVGPKYLREFSSARIWVPGLGDLQQLSSGGVPAQSVGSQGNCYYVPDAYLNRVQLDTSASFIPNQGWTLIVVMVYGSALGTGQSVGPFIGGGALNLRANPYFGSANAVSFDFGGAVEGTTRCSATVPTSAGTLANYVFTTGPRGMEVWNKGRLLNSNAANPIHASTTAYPFGVGDCYGGNSGNGQYFLVAAVPTQISKCSAQEISDNPWQLFKPVSRSLWIPGTVSGGSSHTLTGANSAQTASSGTGAIAQTHLLTGAGSSQTAVSGTGAIIAGAVHVLAAADASQSATSSAAAITQRHTLISAPSVQDSVAGASAIVQRHMLVASACSQAAVSGVGALGGSSIVVEAPPGSATRPSRLQVSNRAPRYQTGARHAR